MEARLLGSAQDAGVPQIGCRCSHCLAARSDPAHRRTASSVAVRGDAGWWLLDVSSDLRSQWEGLPADAALSGLAITHAHAGHIAGLPLLGKEGPAATASLVATPTLVQCIQDAAPWREATAAMDVVPVSPGEEASMDGLVFRFHPVRHRAEISDTVAIEMGAAGRRLLYMPDTDRLDRHVEAAFRRLRDGDVLVFDATFWSQDEVRHRDVASIPHPPVSDTLPRLAGLADDGVRVVLGHLNHTNPLCDPTSAAAKAVVDAGLVVGREGMAL